MNTKYPSSKLTLTAVSLLALTTIAGWIGTNGPFGAAAKTTTQAQTQTQTQTQAPTTRATVHDGTGRSYTSRQQSSSSSAPVARSRGS
jgi:hypothetical protein